MAVKGCLMYGIYQQRDFGKKRVANILPKNLYD